MTSSVAKVSVFVANIIFVVAQITFKVASVADISLLVTKITFVVAEIIFKEDVITSYVPKITYIVAEIFFSSGCGHFFRDLDHFCSG